MMPSPGNWIASTPQGVSNELDGIIHQCSSIKFPIIHITNDQCEDESHFRVWFFPKGCEDYWNLDRIRTWRVMKEYKESSFRHHGGYANANGYTLRDFFSFGGNSWKRHSQWESATTPGEYKRMTKHLSDMKKLPVKQLMPWPG